MQLRQIVTERFRAFERAVMTLPEAGLVLVAGANNSGKSALLSAFDVISAGPSDTASLRHLGASDPAQVIASFTLSDTERRQILLMASEGDQLLDQGAMTEVEFVFGEEEEGLPSPPFVLTQVRTNFPDRDPVPLALTTTSGPGQAYSWSAADWRDLRPGASLTYGRKQQTLPNSRALDPFLRMHPDLQLFIEWLSDWRAHFYHFRALRTGTQRSQNLASAVKLDPTGTNLAATLLHLATDRPGLFQKLRTLIADIVPEIGRLQVRTGGNQLRVMFENSNGDLNLKDLGTGVEQLLMTLVVGLTEAPPFTLLIEEPETNLHPAAQRALLGLLKTWADDRLIVAATHSPVMLDWSPGGDRLWHVTREQDTSHIEQVSADPLPLLNALGVHLSDVLSADHVLVLEGPSDEDILSVWFPELLRNPRVAVLHGGGGDNARNADQFATWLAGTDRLSPRHVLYLRDRDELSAEVLVQLQQSQTVHILKRRELENYLLEPNAIALVLASIETGSIPPASAEEVATAIEEIAEALKKKIIINRVARQVAPPDRLIDHRLRKQLAEDNADKEQFANAVLNRLFKPEDLQAQINTAWATAETEVTPLTGASLLGVAPGEDILREIFKHYSRQRYNKRRDGPAIARRVQPPAEISDLLNLFLAN